MYARRFDMKSRDPTLAVTKTVSSEIFSGIKGTQSPPSISRRRALFAALFAVPAVKTAEAALPGSLSCLPAPNCDLVCPNGGVPLGDGSAACLCSETPRLTFAPVAYSGNYEDLTGKPDSTDIDSLFGDTVEPGEAGPKENQTLTQTAAGKTGISAPFTGSIDIPYFSVDATGLIKEYGSRKLIFA